MHTVTACVIHQQDPILGRESADKRGALDVFGAVRDLFLKTFYCLATISCSKLLLFENQ